MDLENEIKEKIYHYLSKFMELYYILDEDLKFENPIADLAISTEKDIEKAAKLIQKKWKIGNAPFADVVEILETKGICVVELPKNSLYFNTQGNPVEVHFEWPILCSFSRLSRSMQAPT